MSSNHSKKAKTEESSSLSVWQDEFAQVRRYLLDCPVVKSNHPAIQSALKGLDQEVRRRERDAKLQSKFVTIDKPKTTTTTTTATIMDNTPKEPLPSSAAAAAAVDEVMTDDWHAVDNENGNDVAGSSGNAGNNSSSFLGQRLAKASIATIAEHGVRCSTPLEALALILHAAMRSKALGFACTGVPESSLTTTGFAAPIRELPPTQLLPPGWNKNSDNIQLRYRKNGTGALVLQVRTLPNATTTTTTTTTKGGNDELLQVQVWLNRANATEPPSQSLEFPLPQHFNLDSWNKSALREKQVAPALHYKALASLLERFCQTFDLGHVVDDAEEMETTTTTTTAQQEQFPYVDTTVVNLPTRQGSNNDTAVPTTTTMPGGGPSIPPSLHPQPAPPMRPMVPAGVGMDGSTPTTIQDAFPGLRDPSRPLGGDFAGDLVPGGGLGGGLGVGGPPHIGDGSVGPGNLMGPNHPAFFGGTAPPRPGFGMQPRYDPTGPPGGPTDPNNTDGDTLIPGMPGRPRGGRHHPGEPNPDHLRPPNNLNNNNNMFM